MIPVWTKDGRQLGNIDSLAVTIMASNGAPPEIISWGDRFFSLLNTNRGPEYVEALVWVLTDTENNKLILKGNS